MSLQQSIEASRKLITAKRDIPWLLSYWAEKSPEKIFLVWEPFSGASQRWSYAQFHELVERVAGALYRRGVRAGDRLLLHLENCPEFLVSWLACARLGAIVVSSNTRCVASDIAYFVQKTSPVAVITQPRFASMIRQNVPDLQCLFVTSNNAGEPDDGDQDGSYVDFDCLLDSTDRAPLPAPDPQASLCIQFTSGTTSRPKAVLWTHANALWAAQLNAQHMRINKEDVTLAFLPLFHTNAQSYSFLATMWSGGTLVLQPRFSASRFWDVAIRHQCTWSSMIPFCIKALMKIDRPRQHSFRFWAPAVSLPLIERHFGLATFGWWGMTETVSHGIVGDPALPGPDMCIGRPSPGYDVEIRRPDGATISAGETGKLYIRGVRGVSLFREYYGDPEATAAAFDDQGWFDTGDLVRIDEHGDLFFSDRSKDILKVGGENVSAAELERVLMETGWVEECAVVAQKHYMLDEVPVGFVIPSPGAPADLSEKLMQACREVLAEFKMLRSIHIVDSLPRVTLEKIAKNELRDRLPEILK